MKVIDIHSCLVALALLASPAFAQDEPAFAQDEKAQSGKNVITTSNYRSSVLTDLAVRNPQGEELGDVEDVVIDLETQKVQYVAISVGGFLGVGDKLIAVPIDALKLVHGQEDNYFVLDANKRQLEEAPGFDNEHWPSKADPRWSTASKESENIKQFTGTVVSFQDNKLKLDLEKGNADDLKIGPKTVVMIDGQRSELKDLQRGQKIKLHASEEEGALVVRSIEAKSGNEEQQEADVQVSEEQEEK